MERTFGRSSSDGMLHDESLGGLIVLGSFVFTGCDGDFATAWDEEGKP